MNGAGGRIPAGLAVCFARARYDLGGVALRPGRRCLALHGILAPGGHRPWLMLSADNPHGRRQPPARNARARLRLGDQLARAQARGAVLVLAAQSGTGHWQEAQFAVCGDLGWLRRLARRHRQAAGLRLSRLRPPALLWL